jgi:glutathione peroxidase
MKRLLACLLTVFGGMFMTTPVASAASGACPSLLDHQYVPLEGGAPKSLCEYAGKVILVVNTASQCGFTPQYEGLEALYKKFKGKGLVVVGFPANDFGEQEPGSNKDVAQFCQANFGVTFPMAEKTVVKGRAANPLYQALAAAGGGAPRWNFHKYLIDRSGAKVAGFESSVTPTDSRFTRQIERLLAEPAPGR